MSEERKERCETCRFWEFRSVYEKNPDPGQKGQQGACNRNPPTQNIWLAIASSFHSQAADDPEDFLGPIDRGLEDVHHWTSWCFPYTQDHDWCGEWQPKPDAQINTVDESQWVDFFRRLPTRAQRALARKLNGDIEIDSFEKLTSQTAADLLSRHGLGQKSRLIIEQRLAELGLKLKS